LARQLIPVTYPVYDQTQPSDVCALHPELLQREVVALGSALFHAFDTRLLWDREKGFNRAPDLQEAARFAVDPEKDGKTS
jgi:hypothetical protein